MASHITTEELYDIMLFYYFAVKQKNRKPPHLYIFKITKKMKNNKNNIHYIFNNN